MAVPVRERGIVERGPGTVNAARAAIAPDARNG